LRTGFTAADVVANRRKQAAPEHERSLAQATSGFPVVTPRNAKPADGDDQGGKVEEPAEAVTPADTPEPTDIEAEISEPEPDAAEEKVEPEAEAAEKPEPDPDPDPEPEAPAAEKAEEEPAEPAEDKTSVVALPSTAGEGEKTSLLLPAARPRSSADEDKTSVVSMPPRRRIVTATEPATQVVGDLAPDPGFSRPNRPAWTPMQMRPVVRRTNGITILGTTLTRRQAAIGLGIVLTFLLLVGIIVVQAFGNDDTDAKDPSKAQVNPTAQNQPDGGGKSEGPKSSDKPSPSPAKPSSAPPSASSEIPAGWRLYQGNGFRFWVPDSVSGSGGGTGKMLNWGNGRMIRIDIVGGTQDPVDYLNDDSSTGYDKSQPRRLTFNGMPAAEMEYSRNAGGGTKQHVVRRVITVQKQTYVLTWYTEADDWDAAKADLEKIYAGFQPK
jgi:hypothetical protein